MKLAKMTSILGVALGVASVALGMVAEACSSSSSGGGSNCATLAACCPYEPAADVSACTMLASENSDSACLQYLAAGASAYCTPGSGSGSGTVSMSGSGSGVTGIVDSGPPSSGSGTGTVSSSGTGSSAGDSGACGTVPKLYSETTAGVYCPYSGVGGAKAVTCAGGQHCCEPPLGADGGSSVSTCEATATACPVTGSVDWKCLAPVDCAGSAGGAVCCGTGTLEEVAGCGYAKATKFTGTSCAASCTGSYVVCSQDSDCAVGQTCEPMKAEGNDFGHCL